MKERNQQKETENKENKIDNVKEDNTKKKHDNQLRNIFIWMLALVIVFFIFYAFFQSLNEVKYQGLSFTKTRFGEIPVYHTYYFFRMPTGQVIKYNLFVRNNPEENNIPIDSEIEFSADKRIYLTINQTGLECENSAIAISDLASFLQDNQFNLLVGIPDRKIAKETNKTFLSCPTTLDGTVITLQSGDETSIKKTNRNCYDITISNCEILEAVEKFKIQAAADAMARIRA